MGRRVGVSDIPVGHVKNELLVKVLNRRCKKKIEQGGRHVEAMAPTASPMANSLRGP
jgi:hypothetical protein